MALDPPTTADLVSRYPEFQAVVTAAPGYVNAILAESAFEVDETWAQESRMPAMLAWAAHMIAAEGRLANPTGASGGGSSVSTRTVKREKVGDVETEYSDSTSRGTTGGGSLSVMADQYGTTTYGLWFLQLLLRNHYPVIYVI